MVMSKMKQDVEEERENMMTKRSAGVDSTRRRSKKIEFQLELRNRFKTLKELDDTDIMSDTITYMIQQIASIIANAFNKPQKSRISSPTRALMSKRRKIAEKGDNKQRIEYAEICNTIKNKGRVDIKKNNHEII